MLYIENLDKAREFVKKYLLSHSLKFAKPHNKDQCRIEIMGKDGLFYTEIHYNTLNGDKGSYKKNYSVQYGDNEYNHYKGMMSYIFVFNKQGNIIVDLEQIHPIDMGLSGEILGPNDLILPLCGKESTSYFNRFQHIKIQGDNTYLINTFQNSLVLNNRLLNHHIIIADGKIYNFEKGCFLGPGFDYIEHGGLQLQDEISTLAHDWNIQDTDNFKQMLLEKMYRDDLLGGHKVIQETKDDITKFYHIFVFVDMEGNIVSDLFFMDDDFVAIPVTSDNFDQTIKKLRNLLITKIENELLERQKIIAKKEGLLIQIKQKFNI